MTTQKPFGRDETIAALMTAANELFGEKGPNAVSVRDISTRANVNHALLHRHFGCKEALLGAIIDQHMEAFKADMGAAESIDDMAARALLSLVNRPAFTRIFAHLILDQRPLDQFASKSGGAAVIARTLMRHGVAAPDARQFAAIIAAFGLGWSLFRDFAIYAVSADDEAADIDEVAIRMMQRIVRDMIGPSDQPRQPGADLGDGIDQHDQDRDDDDEGPDGPVDQRQG